jgi:hypothetical protein
MSSGQNQNLYSTLLVERYFFFNLLYVGVGVPCLPIPPLTLHKVHVLACIAQHILAELANNLVIYQWEEEQSVYNVGVIYVTPCSAETKDSSMHALLTLVLGQGME